MMRRTFLTLLSLAFLLPLVPFTPGVVASTTYTENFEDDAVGTLPTSDFYESAGQSGQVFVSSAGAVLGTKSLKSVASSSVELRETVGWDLCQGGTLRFSVNFETLTAANSFNVGLRDGPGQGTQSFIHLAYNDPNLLAQISSPGPNSDTETIGAIAANTWYTVVISNVGCTTTIATVYVVGGSLDVAVSLDALGSISELDQFQVVTGSASTTVRVDNMTWTDVNDPPPTAVGSSATAAVTDLVGFDVDQTGSGLIARTNAGDFIRSYAPKTLTQLGSRDTNCNDPDMVATSDRANVYVVCDSGTNNPAFFSIRSFDESVYDFPGDCSPSDDCLDDIPIDGSPCSGFDDDQVLGQIEDLVHIPLDYSYITAEGGLVDDARAIALAYSTTNGFIGVWEFTTRTGLDGCNEERIGFSGTAPEQICVWQPDPEDDLTLIGAVDSGGATKIYEYLPALDGESLDGSLSLRTTLTPSGGVAISCAGDKALIVTNAASSNLHLIDIDTGAESTGFPQTIAGEANRGAHLSGNGAFFFVVDSTVMKLGYAGNGTIFGALTLPSGTYYGAGSTHGGQDAWIATTTTIAYYDTFTAFPTEIGSGCAPSCDEDPTNGVDDALFENAGTSISTALGISTFGGNLFMGSITIALVAVGMGGAPLTRSGGSFSIALAIIGAVLGFLIAWGFGFFTTAAVVSLVVLCVIGLGVKFWMGRSSGG